MKTIVIGMPIGGGDIESWQFDDSSLMDAFCKNLVKHTGRKVYIIEGKLIGSYEVDIPVIFKPE